jgi:putative hydrolase of the HAD superfamily
MTLGIDRLVDFVLVSGEFGSEKPDRAIFEEALRLGVPRRNGPIMVGDSLEHDIAGAQAAGITAVWINRSEYPNIPVVPKPTSSSSGCGSA